MKNFKIFSIIMALLLVVGNISSGQRNSLSQFEEFIDTNIKGQFFDVSSLTDHQYREFLNKLAIIAGGDTKAESIVADIKMAKVLAMQDKININIAADKVIKTIQADVRQAGQLKKESNKKMRDHAELVDKAVKVVFFGKSKEKKSTFKKKMFG